ncbi:archease [Chloroflexota bacterium]
MGVVSAGYSEIEHTADWEIKVWAPGLVSLLEQAAVGMYAISGTRIGGKNREYHQIKLQAIDPESMLVSFLSELLFISETQHLGFTGFQLNIENNILFGTLVGAPIISQTREIKAVTYHNMQIMENPSGLEVYIVFDV